MRAVRSLPSVSGLVWLAFCLTACDRGGKGPAASETDLLRDVPLTIEVRSDAFREGETVPQRHTEDGRNVSPPLAWSNIPPGTREFALICDDPDAPGGTWIHWVLYRIPAGTKSLPENVPPDPRLREPAEALQGRNSWDRVGYGGPAPPPGKPHHYRFTLYALDAELPDKPGLTAAELKQKMQGHILAAGRLTAIYQR